VEIVYSRRTNMWTLAAISGMLAAAPAEPPRAVPAAVEVSFATHAGEGAAGHKRFTRDGCYQTESGGGTGGAGYARDSQAGCYRPADVAAAFTALAAIGGDALVREGAGGGGAGAARGAPARGPGSGGSEARVVVVRADGSRWVAANQTVADQLSAAVNGLPSENQWYAKPPEKPIGAGPQLVVLSVAVSAAAGFHRTQAALASDGRWWCYRNVVAERGAEPKLPAKTPPALKGAAARLDRILQGAKPAASQQADEPSKPSTGREISVEAAWPGQDRRPPRPATLADTVSGRFGAEMRAQSPACDIARAPGSR